MVNWGNVKTLKDTIKESINLFTLHSFKELPEERDSITSKIVVVLEGTINIYRQVGPAKNKTVLLVGQSSKIPAGCWYEISNVADGDARFLIIDHEV